MSGPPSAPDDHLGQLKRFTTVVADIVKLGELVRTLID
jgi:hypothetical protein